MRQLIIGFSCFLVLFECFIYFNHPRTFKEDMYQLQYCSQVLTAGNKLEIQLRNKSLTGVLVTEAGGVRLVNFDGELIQHSFMKVYKSSRKPYRIALIGDSMSFYRAVAFHNLTSSGRQRSADAKIFFSSFRLKVSAELQLLCVPFSTGCFN